MGLSSSVVYLFLMYNTSAGCFDMICCFIIQFLSVCVPSFDSLILLKLHLPAIEQGHYDKRKIKRWEQGGG